MRRVALLLLAGLLCVLNANAAHTRATLLLSAATARPGDTIRAAIRLEMEADWHTYWKNPGGSGLATSIKWQLPEGVTAGEIQWPAPEKLVPEKIGDDGKPLAGQPDYELTTYVLNDEAVLFVPLTLASNLPEGQVQIKATIQWLECKVQCIPGKIDVTSTLTIGKETIPSEDAPLIANARERLPKPGDGLAPRAAWESPPSGNSRALIIEWNSATPALEPDFYPDAGKDFVVEHKTESLSTDINHIKLRKLVTKSGDGWPKEIFGLLVQKSGEKIQSYSVTLPISGSIAGTTQTLGTNVPVEKKSLWTMLLYAFVGGLILNVMPCVLPVIALKILGFVSQAKDSPQRVRKLGLIYAAGVLVSFLALALVVIGLTTAGKKVGWGFQFSNPQFIVLLTAFVTLVALNLFGIFEVTLSGRVLGAADGLASQHGAGGAFFNGVLATVLATPCTAPFLGAAVGFAFFQPASIIILVFLTIGAGLAAPYVALSWNPAWLKFLPKPGAWMERFKIAMGFPMLVTALWLASLTTTFYGGRTWWLGVFLVFLGAAAWVFGEFFQRGGKRRGLAMIFTLLLLVGGYAWPLEDRLRWRELEMSNSGNGQKEYAPKGYTWSPWSTEAVKKARSEGRVVIVDFTADWCNTCNVSVKPALESKAVVEKLKQLDAVALLADNTRFPPEVGAELEKFGRSGVPLVLVYPANASKPLVVLPESLPYPVPYAPVVLKALENIQKSD